MNNDGGVTVAKPAAFYGTLVSIQYHIIIKTAGRFYKQRKEAFAIIKIHKDAVVPTKKVPTQ